MCHVLHSLAVLGSKSIGFLAEEPLTASGKTLKIMLAPQFATWAWYYVICAGKARVVYLKQKKQACSKALTTLKMNLDDSPRLDAKVADRLEVEAMKLDAENKMKEAEALKKTA